MDNYAEWKNKQEIEVQAIDKIITLLTSLRDATALSSYPGEAFGLRKKQPNEYKDFVVSEEYQIRFWRDGRDWVCKWTDREMDFHQKMMQAVVDYAQDK